MMANNAQWIKPIMNQNYLVEFIGEDQGLAEVFGSAIYSGHHEDVHKDVEKDVEECYPKTMYVTIREMIGNTNGINPDKLPQCWKVKREIVTKISLI